VILHDKSRMKIHGLTTAATVWITAVLGIAAGLGAWFIIVAGATIALLLLAFGAPLEARLERLIKGGSRASEQIEDD
jgi:putative Mg2+ transporter-C (MgtC) family protein